MKKKEMLILTGPTAVGKTKLSIELAKAVGGEIISADSVQVYKKMDIGSAKILPKEMDGVRHHLIDVLSPDEKFDVFRFWSAETDFIFRLFCMILRFRKKKRTLRSEDSLRKKRRRRAMPICMKSWLQSIPKLPRRSMKTTANA